MSESIITAIITALISSGTTLVGVLVSNNKRQAVTDYKIEELTREVREHNNFAQRMPVCERDISELKSEVKRLREYHEQ